MAESELAARARALVAELGLTAARVDLSVRPLTGGVASDIAVVTLPGREVCVKFALARLRVAADWRAPVHRNRAEYAWLSAAGAIVPGAVPQLFGWSAAQNGFAMEYLAGPDVRLWKAELLAGHVPPLAAAVGDVLGRIHAASTAPGFDRTPFANAADFEALRIEPYLRFTATRHPALAGRLSALADGLARADTVLVHGDVSPKNILLRAQRPVLLDAECATMGDASFDPAFCLNHLILKAIHLPASRAALLSQARALWSAYAHHVIWEPAATLSARIAALVPALMLARVDGKSPVEYLSPEGQARVRALSMSLIAEPPGSVPALIAHLESALP